MSSTILSLAQVINRVACSNCMGFVRPQYTCGTRISHVKAVINAGDDFCQSQLCISRAFSRINSDLVSVGPVVNGVSRDAFILT